LDCISDRSQQEARVYEITVNGGKIEAEAGATLLSALARHKISLPSVCGGRGICGRCRVKVLDGAGPFTAREEAKLGQEERNAGVRLACQVRIAGNMSVELPKELRKTQEFRARCAGILDLARDIRQIRFELIEPGRIHYVPGQYMQLSVPVYNGNEPVTRAYSIASDPKDRNVVELIVRRAPGGISTTWIFEYLKEGAEVKFSGAYGDFCLSKSGAPAVFVAGASGMAPIRCLLYHMKNEKIARPAVFYFGTNLLCEMFHVEEMRRFEKELPDFRFVPVIARPEEASGWKGQTGLVTEALARDIKDAAGMEAYLCGSPGMIEASVKVLTGLGMHEKSVFYDKFA
jgi:Na+-transporting NADH:ubiquinone oxidoreductase subunit F